jgi:multidrug transporter EmrE-like cation transporter
MNGASANWSTWALAAAAVLCNACAQLLMKQANVSDALNWRQWLSPSLLAAVLVYGLSFALTALVFARLPLSLVSPLMAGAIFVLISVFSVAFLGETLGVLRIAGMACILVGIGLLARSA